MNNKYILSLLAATLLATGCSKDNNFDPVMSEDEGQVLKSALDLSTTDDEISVTRAGNDIDLSKFKINFIKDGESVATDSFLYGEMPEVVTLKAPATYRVTAELGQDLEAAWENPYFKGESTPFEVRPYEITSYIDPIECQLLNIKATIAFDESLASVMSDDSYVEVKVGSNNGLKFSRAEASAGKAGYFRHTGENTLVATFNGTVNGSKIVESKSYSDISKGVWYKVTFKLHQNSGGDPTGEMKGGVTVDASVNATDLNADVNIADDEPLDDSERPTEGDDPDNPDDPTPPTPGDKGPKFETVSEGLEFDKPINIEYNTTTESFPEVKFIVKSTGITNFYCDITSPFLNEEILGVAGLTTHLDLCDLNAAQVELLSGLGFPCNVRGQQEVTFTLTPKVMEMLYGTNEDGSGYLHEFKVTAEDSTGTTIKTLKLQFIPIDE